MARLGWLLGSRREDPAPGGPSEAEACLDAAGWTAERSCDLTATERALNEAGFTLNETARGFLQGYHDLAVDVPVAGVKEIRAFVHFVPEMALRLLKLKHVPLLAALMPASACPIGTTSGHTILIFLDTEGRSYLLDMDWDLFAELASSPAEMVQVLCDGRNGRVDARLLDDAGRPTGRWIRERNEQRWWRRGEFPKVAPFLLPVSLSPARRRPTLRPVAGTAEASQRQRQGSPPSGILVTCGGFYPAPSARFYFVAHCENSLFLRARAGFQVASPPPGIAPGFRTGEMIPYKFPGGR